MTSLIDVIFLLLLFFMLSSTFARYDEVDLLAGGAGAAAAPSQVPPFFLRLGPDTLDLNGRTLTIEALADGLRHGPGAGATDATNHGATAAPPERTSPPRADTSGPVVLVSLQPAVTAQRLTDLLVALRRVPGVQVTVLGQG